ncbi:hypothetical protein ACQ3G6_14565 [Allorhizobium undicola]|uniref:hypothetical protein n=1 Tax=Allorhizobium undicola TaxID=78527 RepID=UPI003D3249B4
MDRILAPRFSGVVLFLLGLLLIAFDLLDGTPFLRDIDDQLRAWQIRVFHEGLVSFRDLTLPGIAMPEPYISPWSRLVDVPYLGFAWLFGFFPGVTDPLALAFQVWPLCMLLPFCLMAGGVLRPGFEHSGFDARLRGLVLVLAAALMTIGFGEFAPTRIDHHNVQILALTAAMYGLCRWDAAGAALVGVGCAVSLLIGLEGLPMLVIVLGGLALADLLQLPGAAAMARRSGVWLAGSLALGGWIFAGPAAMAETVCDAFSAPYLFLMGAAGLVLTAGGAIKERGRLPLRKGLIYGPGGLFALLLAAWLFSECLAGPYQMIDPLSKELWLLRVDQEHGIGQFFRNGQYGFGFLAFLWSAVVIFALHVVFSEARRRPGLLIAFCLAAVSLLLTLVLNRYIRFAAAFVPLFLPLAMTGLIRPAWWSKGAVIAGFLAMAGLALINPSQRRVLDVANAMAYVQCDREDHAVLAQVPPGRLFMPQGDALNVVTEGHSGFTVNAIPYHRAAPALKQAFTVFLGEDAESWRKPLAPYDYLAICRPVLPMQADGKTLFGQLAAGKAPAWLQALSDPPARFQLYRIDHPALAQGR